jgi:hypothetical protein
MMAEGYVLGIFDRAVRSEPVRSLLIDVGSAQRDEFLGDMRLGINSSRLPGSSR